MSGTRRPAASDLVMQSLNLTRQEDHELSMIAARNKVRKAELMRGAVALKLKELRAGNEAGDGRVDLEVLDRVVKAGRLSR